MILSFFSFPKTLLCAVFNRIITELESTNIWSTSLRIRGAVVAMPTQTSYKRRMTIRACAAAMGLRILQFMPASIAATLVYAQNQAQFVVSRWTREDYL